MTDKEVVLLALEDMEACDASKEFVRRLPNDVTVQGIWDEAKITWKIWIITRVCVEQLTREGSNAIANVAVAAFYGASCGGIPGTILDELEKYKQRLCQTEK